MDAAVSPAFASNLLGARHDGLELFFTTPKVATGIPGSTNTNLTLSLSRYERCRD